jgi:hypothetical protein
MYILLTCTIINVVFKKSPQLKPSNINLFIVTAFTAILLMGLVSASRASASQFDLDYETGDLNNAWGWNCSQYQQPSTWSSFPPRKPLFPSPERLKVSSDAAAEGRLGLEATSRATDWAHGGARAELYLCDANKHEILWGDGDEVWYSWSTMFPSYVDFTEQKWLVWTQWHHTGNTGSPPLALTMNKCDNNNVDQCLYLQVVPYYYEKERLLKDQSHTLQLRHFLERAVKAGQMV